MSSFTDAVIWGAGIVIGGCLGVVLIVVSVWVLQVMLRVILGLVMFPGRFVERLLPWVRGLR